MNVHTREWNLRAEEKGDMPEIELQNGGETALFQNVQLGTLEEAKRFYGEVMESYAQGIISERNMRALIYGLSNYLPFLKFEKDVEIEKRVAALEEARRR